MQVQFGPLITYASGKIGGTVFAGFRGRKIAKRRAMRHKPPTEDQRLIELYMRHANRVWRRLGESARINNQSLLFNFYRTWAYHQRNSTVPQQAFFAGEFVNFAAGDLPAYEFPLQIGFPRHYPLRTFSIGQLPGGLVRLAGQAPSQLPLHIPTARIVLFWTDDYDPRAERASIKTGMRYWVSPEVDANEVVVVTDPVSIPSGEDERVIIGGGAMWYNLGVSGRTITSTSLQLDHIQRRVENDSLATRHLGGLIERKGD